MPNGVFKVMFLTLCQILLKLYDDNIYLLTEVKHMHCSSMLHKPLEHLAASSPLTEARLSSLLKSLSQTHSPVHIIVNGVISTKNYFRLYLLI